MFTFKCPNCGTQLEAREEWVGQQSQCSKCLKTLTIPNCISDNSNRITNIEKALSVSRWSKYLGLLSWPCIHFLGGFVIGLYCVVMDKMETMLFEGMVYWMSIFFALASIITGCIALKKNTQEAYKFNLPYSKTLTFKCARFGIVCSIIAFIFIIRGFVKMQQ